MSESVVLLHGLGRRASSMRPLQRLLEAEGFRVLNIDYPSRRQTIEQIATTIHPQIEQFMEGHGGEPLHFVGHSMGGLITRQYLSEHPPAGLCRVVMLGTPNRGSAWADRLNPHWAARRWFGPALEQLRANNAYPPLPEGVEVGIIAGTQSHFPGNHVLGREPSDGTVTMHSTTLDTPHIHTTVRVLHGLLPNSASAYKPAADFIRNGRF